MKRMTNKIVFVLCMMSMLMFMATATMSATVFIIERSSWLNSDRVRVPKESVPE